MTLTNQQRTILLTAGVVFTAAFILRRQVAAVGELITNPNEGTAFEGAGVVGTLGNAANAASGGLFAGIGSALGEFFSGPRFDDRTIDDLTNPNG